MKTLHAIHANCTGRQIMTVQLTVEQAAAYYTGGTHHRIVTLRELATLIGSNSPNLDYDLTVFLVLA